MRLRRLSEHTVSLPTGALGWCRREHLSRTTHRHHLHTCHMCSNSHTQTPRPRDTHGHSWPHRPTFIHTQSHGHTTHIRVYWFADSVDTQTQRDTLTHSLPGVHSTHPDTKHSHMLTKHTQICSHLDTHVSTGAFILSNTDINTHFYNHICSHTLINK